MDTAPIDQALEHADDVENLKKLRQLGGEGASHKFFVIAPLILSLALNSFLSFHNGWNFDNALQITFWQWWCFFLYVTLHLMNGQICKHNVLYVNTTRSLHLVSKYAQIFVRRHYLFREAKLEENCELQERAIKHSPIWIKLCQKLSTW